jgi:hypothetical protein
MGTIKKGVLSGFSGKVGSVVGASWKGIDYIRSLPASVRNPRTEGQVSQRTKFIVALEFLRPIIAYLNVGFKPYASKQSPYNAAMSYNVSNAVTGTFPDFVMDYPNVLVSRGSLLGAEDASATAAAGSIAFAWSNNSGVNNAKETDLAMPLAFNISKGQAVFKTNGAERSAEADVLTIPANWSGDDVQLYLGFVSMDGLLVASSVYLGQQSIV